MANLRQDQVPRPTFPQASARAGAASAVNGRPPTPGNFVLSLRLRMTDSSGTASDVSFPFDSPSASPAAALAADVMRASGGDTGAPIGPILTTRFSNLQSALLAARRLHWAIQGITEAGPTVTAAMAIHSTEDEVSSAAPALETAAPGRVLLSMSIASAIQQLPGLLLLPPSGGEWRELEWQSPAAKDLAADEQSILGLIRALGREDPLASVTAPPPPVSNLPDQAAIYQPPSGLGRSVLGEPEAAAVPLWKKPWAVIGAAAALLALVAVLLIRSLTNGPNPHAAVPEATHPVAPPPASPTPAGPAPAGPAAATQDKPPVSKPAKPSRQGKSASATTEARTEPPAPKLPTGSCGLTETEIPLSLQRAGRLMSAGKLSEAQDAYQRLAGCPSARERALEGLRTVHQRLAAQGSPN